jgi:O-antigen/teichoic acid export membrane protein
MLEATEGEQTSHTMTIRLLNRITALASVPRQCLAVLRLKNFDTSTPEGRSQERYRRAAMTSLAQGFAKGVSILTMLISVPLTLRYLGAERYGMWMTISSVVLMMGFADLGMGLGLMNSVSEAHGRDDRQAAVSYVSSGFVMLSAVALLILTVFALAYPFIPWARIFNVQSQLAMQEAGPAMAVFVACFALNLPLGVVQRVQMGYQEGFINSLWESAGKVFGLLGLLLVIYLQAGLVWLILAVAGAPALAWVLNSFILFGIRRPWLRPRWHQASFTWAAKIFRIGIMFFLLQIAVSLAFTSDNLVAAQVLGPEAVAQYSVAYRMFAVALLMATLLSGPLWPAYGEAMARGDIPWIKRTLIRSLVATFFIAGIPSLFFVLFGPWIMRLWVGPAIKVSFLLLLGLGIWTTIFAVSNALSMFFNGANVLRLQVVCGLLMAISALGAKIWLAKTIGLPGIIWGTIVAFIICCILPYAIYTPRLFSGLHVNNK